MKNTGEREQLAWLERVVEIPDPPDRNSDTGLSGYGEKNDKDDQVKDGKHDHRPHEPAKFSLEGSLLCHRISIR